MASSRLVTRSRDIANVMQRLQDEQESVQKRTFTKWINTHLAKRNPPMLVNDLFEDIKDGVMLIALLEVLSGQKLPCEQGRQLKRIHWVANIGTALKFLEGRRIKLVNINSTDIADGRPSIVLGLVWTIILYFQIEELTSNLPQLQSLSSSTSSVESVVSSETASPPSKRKVVTKVQGSARKALLKWLQYTAAKQVGIEIKDFGQSWRSGVAFHSVIHAIRPDLVDMEKVRGRSNRENLEEAFTLAEAELGIPRLLDPEDVDVEKPDEKSVMTYVAQFLKYYPDPHHTVTDVQENDKEDRLVLRDLKVWAEQFERDIARAQVAETSLQEKYQSFKHFKVQYEVKRKQIELATQSLRKDGKLSLDQAMVKQAWERVSSRLLDWHIHLDKSLPAPLGTIGAWLYRAEAALREEVTVQQAHEETANTIHRKLEQHKDLLKNIDGHKKAFHEIHRTRSVNGVPVPPDQLEDMADRFNFVVSSSELHLLKMEFLELKYRLLSLLVLAESKLKSWIIKYGRRESVELLLQNYISVIENSKFFEQYEVTYQILKRAAEMYAKANGSVEEVESVMKFMSDTTAQWRNLSVEVRSVRSMLEEVIANWDRYSSTVAGLQAWLEDAEKMLNQPEHSKKDFFRHLPHWIQQHTAMNDAGNFLIETCDETISRDLKQQLLLLNGRWRELFMQVKQYARADELDKMRKEYVDGVAHLTAFIDGSNRKFSTPVEMSFLDVKMFVQELENTKQKLPAMEAQYKAVTRTMQLVTKEVSQEEVNEMMGTLTRIKEQLSKVKEYSSALLYECQRLLSPLEELEKQITHFYESLEKVNEIISILDPEAQPTAVLKQKAQDLVAYQENCKKDLSLIERNSQSILQCVASSEVLQHFHQSTFQKKVTQVQITFQNMVRKAGEWRKNIEANSRLMKKFEESRAELEKVIQIANCCLKEKGNPEELLRKHSEFFNQLDQRVLNAFLKACDELTDILPEQEQHSLQEAVRKLHRQWKDLQTEAPYHLIHLKIEVQKSKFLVTVEECKTELARQNKVLSREGNERMIKEHVLFFGDKGSYHLCEKRLQRIEELCQKLPVSDPVRGTLESSQRVLKELKSQIDSTYMKLTEHSDTWKGYKSRFSELANWISSTERELKKIKENVSDTAKYKQCKASVEEIRKHIHKHGENHSWLKSRLAVLTAVCPELEAKETEDELCKLSSDFKGLLDMLAEIENTLGAVGDCVQYKEEVKSAIEELINNSREVQAEAEKILDTENLLQAQQLLLHHQQRTRRLRAKRQDVQKQISQAKRLQVEGGLPSTVREDLQKLEGTLENMQQTMEKREEQLQVTINKWEQFERDKETVVKYLNQASSVLERILNFSSLESLSSELDQTKELSKQTEAMAVQAENLVKNSSEIQLGSKNKQSLQHQAKSIQEQVKKVEVTLEEDIKSMEMMKNKWDHFGNNFEALSIWIAEQEKELETLETSSSPLDIQISQIKVIIKDIDGKITGILKLEEEAESFSQFVTSGERAHIKAKLTQVKRYCEELRDHAQRLEGTITGNASAQQKYEESLKQVKQAVSEFEAKLAEPLTSCSSAAATYAALQDCTDLCHTVEKLSSPLASLSASVRKVANKEKASKEVTALQQKYEKVLENAKEKQTLLETLLAQWQKQEKELPAFLAWLEGCEATAQPSEQYVSADRVKLENELQSLQDLQADIMSHASLYDSLLQLNESLFPTASNQCVKKIKEKFEELDERWKALPQTVDKRINFLQSLVAEHGQFDELLLRFSDWIKQFLAELQATSEINTADQQLAASHNKNHSMEVESKKQQLQSLKEHIDKLCSFSSPEDQQILQAKTEDCFQIFQEASQITSQRQETLDELRVFLELQSDVSGVLHQLKQTVEKTGNIDKAKSELLEKELSGVIQDLNKLESVAISLDGSLTKAQYHLKHSISGQRTSCRTLVDNLCVELEAVQNLLGTKQSEAEALGALQKSFMEHKEQLLKSIEDIEEKADKEGLKEVTVQALQQRLRIFNQLDEELNSHQHELQWLMSKAKQITQKDISLAPETDKEINCLESLWKDTKKVIREKKEQSCILIDLMKEYQSLKSTVMKVIESANSASVIKSVWKDHEDVRRTLSKHEAAKSDLSDKQKDLDTFTNKGKHLLAELKRVHNCDSTAVKTDMNSMVDKWLDVSERIEDNIDRLSVSVSLWDDILKTGDELDGWSNKYISQLNEGINNFSNSQRMEILLKDFQSEVKNKELKLEQLISKISELKELTHSEEPPADLQFIESDLKQKFEHAKDMSETAKETLKDFSTQKMELQKLIGQMTDWLTQVEETLLGCTRKLDPEVLNKVKETQKDLQLKQSSIDSMRENLNTLCRKYHSVELETLGGTVTLLIKKYEAVNLLCSRTQARLQESLEKHFLYSMQEFQEWFSGVKAAVKESSDRSGDSKAIEAKLQDLQGVLESVSEGQNKLDAACKEGESLYGCLSKPVVSHIQEQIAKSKQNFQEFLNQCLNDKKALEACASHLGNFEDQYKKLGLWMHDMEERISTEALGESKQLISEKKKEVQKVEKFLEELLNSRESFDQLSQMAQTLNEEGHGAGREIRLASQHLTNYQNMVKSVKEKLRTCQLALQEHLTLEEASESMWSWVKEVQDKLASSQSTFGSKATLERRLTQIQEILLLKGDGEVKLNMAIGKGEQALKSSNEEGQKVIQTELETLKDVWNDIISTSVNWQSCLDSVISQWNDYLERKNQLEQWLEKLDHKVEQPLEPQIGLKEKFAQLDHFQAIVSEIEDHSGDLQQLIDKAVELYEKTGDDSFGDAAQEELKTQFNDISTVAKEKMRKVEDIVKDHLLYLDAVHEFTDWLHSAKEELHRWSDASGDTPTIQKKLAKINELVESRQAGAGRLCRVETLSPGAKRGTTAGGCQLLAAEMQALQADWRQWEESARRSQGGLRDLLSQMALSEREFAAQAGRLEEAVQRLGGQLAAWSQGLAPADSRHTDAEVVESWRKEKETLNALVKSEHMTDEIKSQLNDLCRFSRDLSTHSSKVSGLIKEYNSLCLQASKGCQSKEQILQQRFRMAFRDFQQWLVNAKVTTAKCFDVPQNISEASASLQKIQEFLSESENGQQKLNLVASKGELLCSVLPKEKAKVIQDKCATAKDDWKNFITTLHQKKSALENLKIQMKDFEATAEPLQEWLTTTEKIVQGSSSRLHDLPSKRREQQKLQSVLEEISCHEHQLNRLKEKAQQLWEEQAVSKSFMRRVSQLSSQYLTLSSLTKEKISRMDRIVVEHQQFSHGVKDLQDWVADAVHMLDSYCHPTADKSVLDSRMLKLESLLAVKQEKEIQMKIILTRGESVLQNTSLEGVPVIEGQLQNLKDSWASLLSACIQCKSQLEGALSKWTSYQEDVHQFSRWMDKVEASMNASERQYAELREKTAALSKAKLLSEEVLSHNSLLETIEVKGSGMAEHYIAQLELQDLQERYKFLKERTREAVTKAEGLLTLHQEYQKNLKAFEGWLEKEKEKLDCLSHLDGDAQEQEATLRDLQDLQVHCAEGQALLNAAVHAREEVIPWGIPQIEDRVLESLRQDWQVYQHRLSEARSQLNATVSRLRLMEKKFQKVNDWLTKLEEKVAIRTGRQSERATKEMQLQQMKKWHEDITIYKDDVEEVGVLAQQILEESLTASRMGSQATQLTSRYQTLLLHVLEQIKFLEEEIRCMEESELSFSAYTNWYGATNKNFRNVITKFDVVDKTALEKKVQKLELLLSDMDIGHSLLKSAREKGERAIKYMEENEVDQLRKEIGDHVEQLEELAGSIRKEHMTSEKCLQLVKEFSDKYKAQTQWITDYQAILHAPVEPKSELYEKKAQLSKYKSIQQTVLSHEHSVKSVVEKGEALFDLVNDVTLKNNIQDLQSSYQELCSKIKAYVETLEVRVKEHEDYNCDLQEGEKWLLHMSSRLVSPDLVESNNLEIITQQLANHKAIMEEIAGFEDRLNNLKNKGDYLIGQCAEHLQAKFKQNIQSHLQGTRDSYSAICSTAQRVYQTLEHELQKHVNHQDTLQQCQTWLSTVQSELKPTTWTPFSLADAVKQVKHFRALQEQANTYLDLLCSMCDLSDATVKSTAADIQQTKQTIEQQIMHSQYLSQGWEEIKQLKAELWIYFQDADQQLQNLKRRRAELELNIAQNMVLQVKEFSQKLQSKQSALTSVTEKMNKLTQGQESPEHKEIGELSNQWLDLCLQAHSLLMQREEDLQRTRDYHDRMNVVEVFLEKLTKEWDNLARSDAESTNVHLEALQKLAVALQERRFALEDLKDQKQKMIEHLNLDDKELVKEQFSHFEQRWTQLEDLVKRKIQVSISTLEELNVVHSKFHELMEWAEEQQPSISEALKQSPPPDLAQSLLIDHLTICSELEAKQLVLKMLVKDADRVMTNLGLNERQELQKTVSDAQHHVACLSDLVGQRRKHLNKALSEKTQFLMAVFQATNQIHQHEKKVMFPEHICLLPEDVNKQIRTCKNTQANLKAYQNEVTGLWAQGRDLMKEATNQEKSEVLGKLQELQNVYDTVLQKCNQRLLELEKNIVSRKYFKEDLDKACHWLKKADIVTFPEVNVMNSDTELYSQLAKYQQILEQSPEYENLLLALQRDGQEVLPSLNEVDHSYLNEKLNSLPQQFNIVTSLAKEKLYKVQEAIYARKEYASLIELTSKALTELEDQFVNMDKAPAAVLAKEAVSLQQSYRDLLGEVVSLGAAVDELNQKKEAFRSTGQPWQPDEMLKLATLYHKLKRQIEQKINLLEDTIEACQEHEKMCMQFEAQLEAVKKEQIKVNEETLPIEEKLKIYHSLVGSLQDSGSLLKRITEHLEALSPQLDSSVYETTNHQVQAWQEKLKSLHAAIVDTVIECENRLVQSIDFKTEICRSLDWLRWVKTELNGTLSLDLKLQSIQEEIRKVQIHQEEVQSSLRIMNALSNKEKERYMKAKELIPADLENTLAELMELDGEVQEAIHVRQATLNKIYSLCQRYYQVTQIANDWLEDAQEFLHLARNGLDVENSEENLRNHIEFFSTENQFNNHLKELQGIVSEIEPFIQATAREQLVHNVAALEEKAKGTKQEAKTQQEQLQRCASEWQEYQIARQKVIEVMNEAEKKLSEFSVAKAASSHEAEEKLLTHKTLVSVVNCFHENITALEEKASQLEKVSNDASKASISRSMTTVWQRWTRLRNVAQEQEKILEDAVQEWKGFNDKIQKATTAIDQLQGRLPESSVEKASRTELLELLDYHSNFLLEVDHQLSSLGLLKQHAVSMLQDVEIRPPSQEELPVMQEIKAMQDRCHNMQQKVKKGVKMAKQELKEREEVEAEINVVNSWIQETKEYLLSPDVEVDTQLQELQSLLGEVTTHRQAVEKMAEQQQNKYLGLYTILPSELSLHLAEVGLALVTVQDQIQTKERETQQIKTLNQEFDQKIQGIANELNAILSKLKKKTNDISQAKLEQRILGEELDSCNIKLLELDASVQDFAEQNAPLAKQLATRIGKLTALHQQTIRQAEYRAAKLSQAASHLEEYNEMQEFISKWIEKANILVHGSIIWNSSSQLRDQCKAYQTMLDESGEIHSDLESMSERIDYLASVYCTEGMSHQVLELGRRTEQLQQVIKVQLPNLQDAAKDMKKFEVELRSLQAALEQAQATLTSPELGHLSLKEQLSHRQHLLSEMESLKPKVQAVQDCQSALRIPEEVVTSLPICHSALRLQEEASRLQHTAIQQCNIMQEAVVQYEQYEQEMKHLQQMIESAHREIQGKPIATSNIQELQVQISRNEELAQKIKGYQEQIASLNSKCKMLTMKAKHATMLLTVTEVEGLSEGMEELDSDLLPAHPTHPSVVMMTAGRCHTLLSPVTEESGEEGTNSEISSPPACRSPSPVANTDASVNQDIAYYQALSAEQLQTEAAKIQPITSTTQEFYEPGLESAASAKLDDLQRSWETLKNVISEKQRTLYEALERQQKYQDTLQSISTKMETTEIKLNESLEPAKSPESQMAEHQALMDEILMLQEEITELQTSLAQELVSEPLDAEAADQMALQSTLTVLVERMATIRMKASGKRQLLEEKLNEQLEEQRQEQALQRYRCEADELDHWLLNTRATLDTALVTAEEPMDMEAQLVDCQNMLVEIEQKVVALSELSVHNENLLMEGKAHTKDEAEQLAMKLRTLKGSLLELQRVLHDKQINIQQGSLQEKEESDLDFVSSQSPSVQEWLAQARTTRSQQQQSTLQQQKELEQELEEQKNLLRSVACRGGEILTQQGATEGLCISGKPDILSEELVLEGEKPSFEEQMKRKWESLNQEFSTKQRLLQKALEKEQLQLYSRPNRLIPGLPLYKEERQDEDKSSVSPVLVELNQAFEDVSSEAGQVEETLHLEQKLYDGVTATSVWLDGVEEQVFIATALSPEEETETYLCKQESLAKEIKDITEEVDKNKTLFAQIFPENSDNRVIIEDTLDCLLKRLTLLESVVNQRCHQMKGRIQQIVTFKNDLKLMFTSVADNKYLVLQKLAEAADRPETEQMQVILQAEEGLKELDAGINELKKRIDKLQIDQPSVQELSKIQDKYDELLMIIGSRRSDLNQNMALKSQYERALQDLADLVETGQEKMAGDQKMIVSSKEEVRLLLDKHKEYFQGLESHMILTETLFRKMSSFALLKETQSHSELMTQASAVLKLAHKRGVELEYILETWMHLDEDYQELTRQLESVEGNIPTVGLVEETEDRLTDRIALFQHLRSNLTEYQPKLYQVLDDGKRLLFSVSCSDLESQLNQLGEHWLSNTSKVTKELHRLETILKHWTRYQSESNELTQWLQSAKERLEFWSQQSLTVPQELETVRDHLNSFLEFSKEVDAKSSQKSSVLSTGNQLLRLKKVDTAALRAALSHIETQWTELLTQIPAVQEKLHQLQMDKIPSRHAITEVMSWISLMENVIQQDEENIENVVGQKVIQDYIQKYKGFKIDLNCKQLTVDFVNQSVLQISSQDVESKRSDKTDFAEQLGAMNRRWQILQGLITEKIQLLESLQESWTEYENSVQCLKTWFETQEKKLKQQQKIGDQASVQNALKDCQELEESIKTKEKEVENIQQSGLSLVQNKKEEVSSAVMNTLQEINHSWANLDHMVSQLKILLQSVLDQWSIYKVAYEELNSYLTEARYSLSHFYLLTGSLEAVKGQVDNLQSLQDELEKQENSLQKFGSVTSVLLKECHPPVTETLTNTLKEVNMRWNNLLQETAERLRASRALLQLWQRYKDCYEQCSSTVRQQEDQTNELLKTATSKDITDDEVTTWIQDCNDVLMDLKTAQESLVVLQELGEELKSQVEASAAAAIQSDHLSLNQNLSTLEQALRKQQAVLQAGVLDYQTFAKNLEVLETWITEAEEILKEQDPSHSSDLSAIQSRMEQLKSQMLKFSSMAPDLDRLNELGYRLPLNDKEIKRMQNLNRHWSLISSQTTERFSKLQSFLLQQQTFLEKCETWMDLLVQTEQKLAAEISGNYQSLLEQQRAHELFQAEMFSRQQILHSIISDGQLLLEQGQVDDRDEFSMKLTLLSNQWQGVIRRAQQRRGIIDSQIHQWQRYREMAEKLRKWLMEMSRQPVTGLGNVPIPLQQARALLDEVQLKEKVLLRQQGSYILTVEAGKQLLLSADSGAEAVLQTELTEIQERWKITSSQLEQQKKQLALLLKDWEKSEKAIGDSLEKLRSFKKKLSQPLPDHHDELHAEQIRCKELENAVEGWTDDLAHLSLLKETLSIYISADDISILSERIELLHRQWEELCHQVSLRRQQVSERLNEWAVFSEKNKELCEWLTQMESKVSQNGDILIEEMIEKLKKDYQEEIAIAQKNKIQLQQMGERLAKASQESKASEIEYKLGKINDRWQHLLDLIAAR
ncbi:nesprin-1 isoform X4 [Empidonax traillii]|uniref:nesprin-1 isoform X4 n=1 Tax=Empidonax traillii TaxID=164674 RepID=UPI000FFD23DF|nr:nesprin-1 isoform X4 [Empidonax traillii]